MLIEYNDEYNFNKFLSFHKYLPNELLQNIIKYLYNPPSQLNNINNINDIKKSIIVKSINTTHLDDDTDKFIKSKFISHKSIYLNIREIIVG